MAIVAGFFFAMAMAWVLMVFLLRWIQDVPLGPVNSRARGDAYRLSEQRSIEAQRRLAEFWRTRLWPVALGCFVAGIVLSVLSWGGN